MESAVHLSGEINLGQLGIIITLLSTGIGIYVKSRLDVQKLTLSDASVVKELSELKLDITEMRVRVENSQAQIQELHTEMKVLQATSNITNDISRAINKLITLNRPRKENGSDD